MREERKEKGYYLVRQYHKNNLYKINNYNNNNEGS